jgi:DNA-binding CsgD family transcriptional regulator
MPSYQEVIDSLEERLFVGRKLELKAFRGWLLAGREAPELLNVYGPGGIGKSALLRAFRRLATAEGFHSVLVEGRAAYAELDQLPKVLGHALGLPGASAEPEDSDFKTNADHTPALLILDDFDDRTELIAFVQDWLLPRIDVTVRVVIASRRPLGLASQQNDRWQRLIRPLPLGGLHTAEARLYLSRCGIAKPHVVADILRAAGRHPLALTLAADLALKRGVRVVTASPEWRQARRAVLERLLDEIDDPSLRRLLEVAAVAHEFDEATLADVAGGEATKDFDLLWRLSIVRATEHGLMLHPDARRMLTDDLRWRHPERLRCLRRQVVAHFQQRMLACGGNERAGLLIQQLFAWEDQFVRDFLFPDIEPGQVSLQTGRPQDLTELVQVFMRWLAHLPAEVALTRNPKDDRSWLEMLLLYPGIRVRVARATNGRIHGFSAAVAVCRDSLPLLMSRPELAAALHAYPATSDPNRVPIRAEQATVTMLLHLAYTDRLADAARSALARDLLGVVAHGGVFLASTPVPAYQRLLEHLRWGLLAAAHHSQVTPTTRAYVLDLKRMKIDDWIRAGTGMSEGVGCLSTAVDGTGLVEQSAGWADRMPLTRRERELAALVARGLRNRDIAARLQISVRTVDAHVEHIRTKLGFHSRTEIARWATLNPIDPKARGDHGQIVRT